MSLDRSPRVLSGNEIIVEAALEAGARLLTGYPGSPLADYFNILEMRQKELKEKGIRVVIANNEANAGAMASGAKLAGQNVVIAMKSMGLHVASDALSVGNFANTKAVAIENDKDPLWPGVVVVVGDDPWSISTSTPADSRFLFKHLHMPFLEPSNPDELRLFLKAAMVLSQRSSLYVGVLLTTALAEGGGRIDFQQDDIKIPYWPKNSQTTLDPKTFDLGIQVMVPPNSLNADKIMEEQRWPQFKKEYTRLQQAFQLDKIYGAKNGKIGFVSSGHAFEIVREVLEGEGLLSENQAIGLYKSASSYPLYEEGLIKFVSGFDLIVVVEEKRGLLEQELANLIISKPQLSQKKIVGKHHAKLIGEHKVYWSNSGGLTHEHVLQLIYDLGILVNRKAVQGKEISIDCFAPHFKVPVEVLSAPRFPTFCPGCPHRETLSVMKEVRSVLAKENISLISHGDVGCYSLSFLPPFKEMHDLSAMGQGGAMGSGTDLFTTNPSVVLMGDSTFFHSGMVDVSHSVQCGHSITYILLDNDNTAMTGHQVTPVTGHSVEGHKRPRQKMAQVARSLGVKDVFEVNPSDRYFYLNLFLSVVKTPGVKVIVSDKECGLTYQGKIKAQERQLLKSEGVVPIKKFFQINPDACEDCRVCLDETGCPGLTKVFDAYGSKVAIDPNICVSDSYCTKLKACPSFEQVEVFNYNGGTSKSDKPSEEISKDRNKNLNNINGETAPDSSIHFDKIVNGMLWKILIIGVGGSGITTIGKILASAGEKMADQWRTKIGYKFMEQKGLAQRNGRVSTHLVLHPATHAASPVIGTSQANVILSTDLLDAASALNYLNENGIIISDEEFQYPLSILLDREEEKKATSPSQLKEILAPMGERIILGPFKKIATAKYGHSVYANSMILGVAFALGKIPFSKEDIVAAIKAGFVKNQDVQSKNIEAFVHGITWYQNNKINPSNIKQGSNFNEGDIKVELSLLKKSLTTSYFWPWNKSKAAQGFEQFSNLFREKMPHIPVRYQVQYIHDLLVFDLDNVAHKTFKEIQGNLELIKSKFDSRNLDYENYCIAIRTLMKTYFIKDEVFVAHQMISPVKQSRDSAVYSRLGKSYAITRINRPSFDLGARKIEFDLSPRYWMLAVMRHQRWLRNVLPAWHRRERDISMAIRNKILKICLESSDQTKIYKKLKSLENIKGYRHVRYANAIKYNLDVMDG